MYVFLSSVFFCFSPISRFIHDQQEFVIRGRCDDVQCREDSYQEHTIFESIRFNGVMYISFSTKAESEISFSDFRLREESKISFSIGMRDFRFPLSSQSEIFSFPKRKARFRFPGKRKVRCTWNPLERILSHVFQPLNYNSLQISTFFNSNFYIGKIRRIFPCQDVARFSFYDDPF